MGRVAKNPSRPNAPVIVIGELNPDLLATGLGTAPHLGREILARNFQIQLGSASAIFASGMARLGHRVSLHSRVGHDAFGRYCLKELGANGISSRHVLVAPRSDTGVTIALSTASDRALVTFLGAIAEICYTDLPKNLFTAHKHLHLTSFFLQRKLRSSFARLFREARAKGLTTSFDPNFDPSHLWTRDVWDAIAETDVLFANEEEALLLTKQRNADAALHSLAAKVPCVVIKLGAKGAVATKGKEAVFSPAFRISPVDTTGAGDSFAAGFIHSYLAGKNLSACLLTANACGALSAMHVGGTAGQPTQRKLALFLRKQKRGRRHSSNRLGHS